MILVDTGFWYANTVPADPAHVRVASVLRANQSKLITTDYIIDEVLTLLRARRERAWAIELGHALISEELAQIEWITAEDFAAAWRIFHSFGDKAWSFTDCTSYAVMKRLGIQRAFTLDDHFRQFGFVTVLP